jgi:hypothetical protein
MSPTEELGIFPIDNRTAWRPGETVELSAMWALRQPPGMLEARLFWYTRGKGTEDLEVVASQPVSHPAAAGEYRFRFTLPLEPWSFSGKLITLGWAFELVADKQSARWDFALGPEGREILLHAPPP